jgi:sucrose phosphorylase
MSVLTRSGRNDVELLQRSRVGRDINRHYYTSEEIAEAVQKPVVDALFRLIRFRNNQPAFDGEFGISGGGTQLVATWTLGEEIAELSADLASPTATVRWTSDGTTQQAALDTLP